MNHYYPRYMFPSVMMLGVAAVSPIVFLFGRRPRLLIAASSIALVVSSI